VTKQKIVLRKVYSNRWRKGAVRIVFIPTMKHRNVAKSSGTKESIRQQTRALEPEKEKRTLIGGFGERERERERE
jgi:hypothetical protein